MRHRGATASAAAVVPIVMELVRPERVIDIGCGTGTWLSVFLSHGVRTVVGIDGPYVRTGDLEIPPECFKAADLAEPLTVDERFDLAVCLEVGEHLPPERSAGLVADLVRLAPVVLFSGAVPGQGGTGHVNERWQDEWASEFADHDYAALDIVRPRVWGDPEIDWWYAQNTVLFAGPEVAPELGGHVAGAPPLRIVHPRGFEHRLRELGGAVEALDALPEVRVGRRVRALVDGVVGRLIRGLAARRRRRRPAAARPRRR